MNLQQPIIFFEGTYVDNEIIFFKKTHPIWREVDIYTQQLKELFEITHPSLISSKNFISEQNEFIQKRINSSKKNGNWVYFPWNGYLVHSVNAEEYYLLRTNRNKNLITEREQKTLKNLCVGILGLSVGSNIALTLAYQGIADNMKLAEFDTLETSNLNRIRASLYHIGTSKISIAARQLYEINPYIKLKLFDQGLTNSSLEAFINQKPKPSIIFEIIDNFEMKIRLRLIARKIGVPIIMMANLGDSILIDLERYDLDKKLALFNGVIGNLPEKILEDPTSDNNKYAVAIVGKENIPTRALESVMQIGKTLIGRPQLGSTVNIGSGLGAYLVRRLTLGPLLPSGRYKFTFDSVFA